MRLSRTLKGALLLMLPTWVSAQVLDFDSVCTPAPCTLGTQYSALGITFVPNLTTSAQIVAAGTDGLTGTNGGAYARITTAPTQIVINLSRDATFLSLQASRAASSTGAVTLAVSAFKAGVQVGTTQNVSLAAVDAWVPFSFTDSGGFDSILLSASGAANNTFGIDNVQFGGRCNGFSDVLPGASFCDASEWLANRSVTLGCAQGAYCPSDSVTRAAMALFMNRLGTALTPAFVTDSSIAQSGTLGTSVTVTASNGIVCSTPAFTVTGYPRKVLLNGFASFTPNAAGQMVVYPAMSTDGGTTWAIIGSNVFNASLFSATDPTSISTTVTANLSVGTTYTFALYLRRRSGAATTFSQGECGLTAALFNRDGTSAPFDVPDAGPPRE